MIEEMTALGSALITGIFLVFVVMAIQFESPKFSMMIMTTIPFALIGSFGLLFIADSPIQYGIHAGLSDVSRYGCK